MQPVTYRRRRGPLSRSEREWRVESDALVTCGKGRERRYRWRDIVSVGLYRDPAPNRPWRYVFELQPKDARKIIIDNAHFVSRGNFEERSQEYTPFVRAAVASLAEANPKVCALVGETGKRWFFLLIGALIALGLLAYLLATVHTPLDALPYAGLIKLGIILAMLPVFWGWVLRSLPRGVPLQNIPEKALPPDTAS